ncbi:MOSC domain-containing protein [Kitasatospora sp. LaBMicrA B282]|uniref:MOSC domain-containing protein n=1 Tax=Kitasatospora sp. LaBMicrA B282 TaxID=3420949 RepID=UPI003D0B0846
MPLLRSLHRYPVKSMHRQDLDEAVLEPWGLRGDRRWMLARPDGTAITQRDLPELARYRPQLDEDGALRLTDPDGAELHVPAPRAGEHAAGTEHVERAEAVEGNVFGNRFAALAAEEKAQLWFAERFADSVGELRLLHLADPLARRINPDFSEPGETVSMADGYPLLATTTASLEALNEWLLEQGGAALPMTRFRPNLVVEGVEAWSEDGWQRVRVGTATFRAVKLCGRCIVTTTDQERGERTGQEPLRTLNKRRRIDKKAIFGVNLIPERPDRVTGTALGTLRVGDEVTVLARGERLPAV